MTSFSCVDNQTMASLLLKDNENVWNEAKISSSLTDTDSKVVNVCEKVKENIEDLRIPHDQLSSKDSALSFSCLEHTRRRRGSIINQQESNKRVEKDHFSSVYETPEKISNKKRRRGVSKIEHNSSVGTGEDISLSEATPSDLRSDLSGVYFHIPKREWRAVIGRGNRRQQKTFSVRKYGFVAAKRHAEYFRTQFDLTGYVYDSRRTGGREIPQRNNTTPVLETPSTPELSNKALCNTLTTNAIKPEISVIQPVDNFNNESNYTVIELDSLLDSRQNDSFDVCYNTLKPNSDIELHTAECNGNCKDLSCLNLSETQINDIILQSFLKEINTDNYLIKRQTDHINSLYPLQEFTSEIILQALNNNNQRSTFNCNTSYGYSSIPFLNNSDRHEKEFSRSAAISLLLQVVEELSKDQCDNLDYIRNCSNEVSFLEKLKKALQENNYNFHNNEDTDSHEIQTNECVSPPFYNSSSFLKTLAAIQEVSSQMHLSK